MKDRIRDEMQAFAEFLNRVNTKNIDKAKNEFFHRIDVIAELIDSSPEREKYEEEFYQICHNLDDSLMHNRTREKPLGYAGDFQLIDWIYTQKTALSGRGKFFDLLFHTYEAAQSVRNRKTYFINKCIALSKIKKGRLDILNLASGSCRDVLETFIVSRNGANMHFHCVDHEPKAMQYAEGILSTTEMKRNVHLDTCNVFRIKTDKKYDLIWSAGLFDYLEDRVAILLIKRIWKLLKDGGQIIFGNFSPDNPTKRGMELIGKWYLIHRTANELVRLVTKANVPFKELDVESEELGINLFCVITK